MMPNRKISLPFPSHGLSATIKIQPMNSVETLASGRIMKKTRRKKQLARLKLMNPVCTLLRRRRNVVDTNN
eukprot:scaffold72451_cov23-Cyclotella_meneghiniana.AAC.1